MNSTQISQIETSEKLNPRQQAAVKALLEGRSWRDAALKAHCSLASIKRWHSTNPAFRAALAEGQRQALFDAAGRLANGCSLAIDTLVEIAGNPDVADSTRVRASEVILTSAVKVFELGEIQRKVETLEALINDSQ